MRHSDAYKMIGTFVAQSGRLCDVLLVRLRATFNRALIAIIFFLVVGGGNSFAESIKEIKRISSINKDLGEVRKIYLHAGLVSTLEFKQAVIGVKVGNTDSIKAEISPSNPKEVTLRLKHQSAEPTNMIVRVDRQVYVFDLIPSRVNHQDYVQIRGSYGAPSVEPVITKARSTISAELNASEAHDEGVRIQFRAPKSKLIESIKLGDE